ncbi:MAG TPA: hypothetical protein PKC25_09690, partial [Candidatus Rifleibacterium sp.]|nr:hypothetical protein [Candidatus Rifleibacterium sp.]
RMNEEFDLLTAEVVAAGIVKKPAVAKSDAKKAQAAKPAVTVKPGRDSYNLYADLMLRLAEFMRNNKSEEERSKKLAAMLSQL